jgi:hypothetical protein
MHGVHLRSRQSCGTAGRQESVAEQFSATTPANHLSFAGSRLRGTHPCSAENHVICPSLSVTDATPHLAYGQGATFRPATVVTLANNRTTTRRSSLSECCRNSPCSAENRVTCPGLRLADATHHLACGQGGLSALVPSLPRALGLAPQSGAQAVLNQQDRANNSCLVGPISQPRKACAREVRGAR